MRNSVALKVALTPLLLGVATVGCSTSQTGLFEPTRLSAKEAQTAQDAGKVYALAQQAHQSGDFQTALTHAERAVELSPRDAGYRMLLGDLYMKNGRFRSAATAFSDVLTLHPANDRARFNLALAQIALGDRFSALTQLERLAKTASAADLGLAYALAGQPDRAVAMLEPAAREENADGRVRQNLALSYALLGDWQRARITAAQDLSPADLQARMEQWSSFVQPQAQHEQVASLLGVKAAEDAGQPTRLALAPAAPVQLAEAAPAPTQTVPVSASPESVAVEAPVEQASYQPPAWLESKPAAAPQPAKVEQPAGPAPVRASASAAPRKVMKGTIGKYVVQLGAYDSPRLADTAWASLQRRYGLNGATPVRATVSLPKGTFHRLSVGGFASHADAARACSQIKGKGGACFVRPVSGDAPIRLASR